MNLDANGQSPIAEAMSRLWERFLPLIEERVSTLEAAAMALEGDQLAPAQRELACAAAHKLAGVLGSFGLAEGTELAREAEIFYSNRTSGSSVTCARISEIPARIRHMIDSRRSYPPSLTD